MTTLEAREKCLRNHSENGPFRALRARQTRNRPSRRRWKGRGPKPAKTLLGKAVRSIRRVGIGAAKWKFRLKCFTGALRPVDK
jgi:hypothetical protein